MRTDALCSWLLCVLSRLRSKQANGKHMLQEVTHIFKTYLFYYLLEGLGEEQTTCFHEISISGYHHSQVGISRHSIHQMILLQKRTTLL